VTKKKSISSDDYKDWFSYTKEMKDVYDKDININTKNGERRNSKIRIIDLHGFSLETANINIKKFINESFEKKLEKLKL